MSCMLVHEYSVIFSSITESYKQTNRHYVRVQLFYMIVKKLHYFLIFYMNVCVIVYIILISDKI